MPKKLVIILTIIAIIIIAIAAARLLSGEDDWICENGDWIKHGAPNAPMPNKPCGEEQNIGGQRDEHGCLTPAGYSWCEQKQKCLRVWEEACGDEDLLKNYLRDNLSALSPQKEVLGGKFYVTNLKITAPGAATVDYEDGHIALRAQFNFIIDNDRVTITDFKITEENPPPLNY